MLLLTRPSSRVDSALTPSNDDRRRAAQLLWIWRFALGVGAHVVAGEAQRVVCHLAGEAAACDRRRAAQGHAYGSTEAKQAIAAAVRCEQVQTWLEPPSDGDDDECQDEEWVEREGAWDLYVDELIRLSEAYPEIVCCEFFDTGLCTHGKRCACGSKRAPWPWTVIGDPVRPFCACWTAAERMAWNLA